MRKTCKMFVLQKKSKMIVDVISKIAEWYVRNWSDQRITFIDGLQ